MRFVPYFWSLDKEMREGKVTSLMMRMRAEKLTVNSAENLIVVGGKRKRSRWLGGESGVEG